MPKDTTRQEYVRTALESVRELLKVLPHLTEPELYAVLELEARSSRRRSHMDRVIGRLVAIEAERLRAKLVEDYYNG